MTDYQGMLTPPKHLIPSLTCPYSRVCHALNLWNWSQFVIFTYSLINVCYIHLFITHCLLSSQFVFFFYLLRFFYIFYPVWHTIYVHVHGKSRAADLFLSLVYLGLWYMLFIASHATERLRVGNKTNTFLLLESSLNLSYKRWSMLG